MTSVGEQLPQGLWVCWFGKASGAGERWTKRHRGSSAFRKRKNKILQSCTDAPSERTQLFSRGGERLQITTMLPSLGNRRARMICTGKMT